MGFITLITLSFFIIYNIYVIRKFGLPESLSQTSYLFLNHNGKYYMFSVLCILLSISLLPAWVSISVKKLQILVYLSLGGLLVSGMTPMFHRSIQKPFHYLSAVVTFVCYVIWFAYTSPTILILNAITIGILILLDHKDYVYHAESIIALTLMIYILYKI